MAQTIMDVIHENINPTSVAAALYELMLDWRALESIIALESSHGKRRDLKVRRDTYCVVLSKFFGIAPSDMRRQLKEHFDL